MPTLRTVLPAAVLAALLATAPPVRSQPLAVSYTVVFEATWSAETHPTEFPGFPHFSPLIGGTHDDSAIFWMAGEPASLGIKRMAEWGATSPLDAEVGAAIGAGAAGEVIAGPGGAIASPGTSSASFTAEFAHPLVTLVTMVAPSPDWFVGVAGLSLLEGGAWVDTLVVDLYPFDAGTDSGASFESADLPTNPPEPIAAITGDPFTPGLPLGTFTFILQGAVADVPAAAAAALTAYPNPFNPKTTIAFELAVPQPVALEIFDLVGRRLAVLRRGRLPAGPHAVVWDGRDAAGRSLPSGPYLLRLQTGPDTVTRKLLLAR